MPETPPMAITPEEASIVRAILRQRIADRPVWVFGSRATSRARRRSDLDLAVGGESPLSLRSRSQLADDFDRSDLPMRVDVVDLNAITPEFRERIERDFIQIQAAAAVQERALA